jgi:protein-tyrosine phosphatase
VVAAAHFRLLLVCTGNVCRSALAQQLARLRLAGAPFTVDSAGTGAVAGAPMDPQAAMMARELGASTEEFVARALTAEQVAAADLVLTADRDHRAAVVRLHPPAHRYAFTLTEFARLAGAVRVDTLPGDDPVARAVALVRAAAGLRGTIRPPTPTDDDIPDPIGTDDLTHRKVGALITTALAVPLDLILRAPAGLGPATAPTRDSARAAAATDLAGGPATAPVTEAASEAAAAPAGEVATAPAGDAAQGQGREAEPSRAPRRRWLRRAGLVGLVLLAAVGWLGLRGWQARDELLAARADLDRARIAVLAGDQPAARAAMAAAAGRTGRADRITGDPIPPPS